jgi:hypothetical protein
MTAVPIPDCITPPARSGPARRRLSRWRELRLNRIPGSSPRASRSAEGVHSLSSSNDGIRGATAPPRKNRPHCRRGRGLIGLCEVCPDRARTAARKGACGIGGGESERPGVDRVVRRREPRPYESPDGTGRGEVRCFPECAGPPGRDILAPLEASRNAKAAPTGEPSAAGASIEAGAP